MDQNTTQTPQSSYQPPVSSQPSYQPSTPPQMPLQPEHSKKGPLIAIVVLILVLIIAALFLFGSGSETDTSDNQPVAGQVQEVQPVTSTADDVDTLEADLEASINGLDTQNF